MAGLELECCRLLAHSGRNHDGRHGGRAYRIRRRTSIRRFGRRGHWRVRLSRWQSAAYSVWLASRVKVYRCSACGEEFRAKGRPAGSGPVACQQPPDTTHDVPEAREARQEPAGGLRVQNRTKDRRLRSKSETRGFDTPSEQTILAFRWQAAASPRRLATLAGVRRLGRDCFRADAWVPSPAAHRGAPNDLSPASPSPGTMYPRPLSPGSMAHV